MIGPYEIELVGKSGGCLFFKLPSGQKRVLKDQLSKKHLAMELKIGPEDAKVFRDETWLKAADLKEWTTDEVRQFWQANS